MQQEAFALDPVTENLLQLRDVIPGAGRKGSAAGKLDWASIPPSVNMRREMEDLQVNFIQQGSRNSCAVFSATSVLEFQQRRLGNDIDISEQYTLWAAKKAGANPTVGLTVQELAMAFDLYKVCREEVMPYKSSDIILEPTDLATEDAKNMPEVVMDRVVDFHGRIGQTPEEIFRVCKTLAKNQPVCIASEWGNSEKTLNKLNELYEVPMAGFHMVVLVGYEIPPDNPMGGHFLLRNSWGMSWGDFGYAKMPFSYAQKHAMEAVTFRFNLSNKTRPLIGKTKETDAELKTADGLGSYLLLTTMIGLISAVLASYLTIWMVGKNARSVRSALLYLPGSLLYYLPLAWTSGALLGRLKAGSIFWISILLFLFFSLLIRWCKATGKRFQIADRRAVGFVIVAMGLWNLFGWAGSRFMPMESFHTWKAALQWVSPVSAYKLAGGTVEQRAAFLKVSQSEPNIPSGSGQAFEKTWLLKWSEELKQEQDLMLRNHPIALHYYKQRVASYEKLRQLHMANSSAVTASSNATKADEEKHLWEIFYQLKTEKATLDPADAAAVAHYNQKVAAYQLLKSAHTVVKANPSDELSVAKIDSARVK